MHYLIIKLFFSLFPIWHMDSEKIINLFTVIRIYQVCKFVKNNILNATNIRFEEIFIQSDFVF